MQSWQRVMLPTRTLDLVGMFSFRIPRTVELNPPTLTTAPRAAGGAESGSFSIGAIACLHSLVADYPECLPLPTGIRVVRRGVGRGRRPLSRGLSGLEEGSKVSQEGLPTGTFTALREERVRQNPIPERISGINSQGWVVPSYSQADNVGVMDIRIFDVEHGDCILILSSKNEAVLVDCGWSHTTGWRVSDGLAKQGFGTRRKLHHVIITHPDQDHVADLPNVLETLKPIHVWQHPQLYLKNIADLKATLSQAQSAYLASRRTTTELQPLEASRQFRTMELHQFYLPVGS